MRASRPLPWLAGQVATFVSVIPFFILGDDGWWVGLFAAVPLAGLAVCTAPYRTVPKWLGIVLRLGVYFSLLAWLFVSSNVTGSMPPVTGLTHLWASLAAVLLMCVAIVGRKPAGPAAPPAT